ncbi:MutS-related protein [Propionicimonas sp.]|uniref:MutS-related protein n=1 Tax=Propionicimonas sp. TaxID=1955623 RepID=UPI0039E3CB1F
MKVHLLFPDRNADLAAPIDGADDLIADLDLEPVLAVMLPGRTLEGICPAVLLNPLVDPAQIGWRQRVLADVLADQDGMRALFALAGRAPESQHSIWMYGGRTADSLLSRSVHGLRALLPLLRELVAFARRRVGSVGSDGLGQLYARLVAELPDSYLDQLSTLLAQLEFPQGVVTRARLDASGMLAELELLAPGEGRRRWWQTLGVSGPGRFRFTIAERDEAGARALEDLRGDAIHDVAATLARACDHVVGFFRQLQGESGFYVGCLQLHDRLAQLGVPMCWPVPESPPDAMTATGLSCLSHAIRTGTAPVPSDLPGPCLDLAVVIGANQGGKTTFLRSVGCAQLLFQAGVFVPATAYRAAIAPAVHTHFRRAEDDDLASGKLEEELVRMSRIVDRCRPGDLLLMNESFASTDEVEGSYLAVEVIDALLDRGLRVLLVTHFHRLARHYAERPRVTFLVAERRADGTRTHRLLPGAATSASHALDIYRQVFGSGTATEPPTTGPGPLRGSPAVRICA